MTLPSKPAVTKCLKTAVPKQQKVVPCPESSGWQGPAPSEGTRKDSAPGLSLSFWYFLDLWQHNSSFHMTFSLLCESVSEFPDFICIPVILD